MANPNKIPRTHYTREELLQNSETMPNGCIEWRGNISTRGYGRLTINKKLMQAHRYSLTLAVGEAPGLFALHSCDNPPCINPDHLRWGTIADNNADTLARNRKNMPKGQDNPKAKLTNAQVREIRAFQNTAWVHRVLANHYGVSVSLIKKVMYRELWGHIN